MLLESMFKSRLFTTKPHSKWLIYGCAFSALELFHKLDVKITENSYICIKVYFSWPTQVDSKQVTMLALILTCT